MANKYPYVSSAGPLVRIIEHLRMKSFPNEITATTLQKLGIAPKNESYLINVLRFLGVIDDKGKQVTAKAKVFTQVKDDAFATAFEGLVKVSYKELFDLHRGHAWDLDRQELKQFFRTSDHTSDVVGGRQAGTFSTLAGLSGHGDIPSAKETGPTKKATKSAPPKKSKKGEKASAGGLDSDAAKVEDVPKVGLTVRIEVNLPADGDQGTYDRIFRSIRKNLIDGK